MRMSLNAGLLALLFLLCGSAAQAQTPVLETVILEEVGDAWVSVALTTTYTTPVIVCSIYQSAQDVPKVVRLNNVTATGFDVRLQNPSNSALQSEQVYCLVTEQGVWTLPNGLAFEAQTYTSTTTDGIGNWGGEEQTYAQSYTEPVVFGQVMSYEDDLWSVFWSRGPSRDSPPNAETFIAGKHVGQDSVNIRNDETIGYIVFEAGDGQVYGNGYRIGVSNDAVVGYNNSPHQSELAAPFSQVPEFALVTQMGMDGGDGSWALISGDNVTEDSLPLSVDEDQTIDPERGHTSEQVGFLLFAADWTLQDEVATSDSPTAPQIAPLADRFDQPGDEISIQVDAEDINGDPISYAANNLPADLSIDQETGLISGTLSENGIFNTTITATDGTLASEEALRWIVRPEEGSSDIPACAPLDFTTQFIRSYDQADQDRGTFEIQDNGVTLLVANNGWKAIEFDYTIRPETILEFDFKSDLQGQRHGIGFDVDLDVDRDQSFMLFGTAGLNGSIEGYQTYPGDGEFHRVIIPVGEHFAGQSFSFMFFYAEQDQDPGEATSFFRNLQIYDDINRNAICDNVAPVIATLPDIQSASGKQVTVEVLASDHENDPLTYSATGLPDGVTIDPQTGIIQGTLAQFGIYTVTVQATDGLATDEIQFVWEVLDPENLPPMLAGFRVDDVSSDWTPVSFERGFTNPVVVCSPHQINNPEPFVIRMQNVEATGFEVRLQNPSGVVMSGESLFCLTAEEGAWILPNGSLFEAHRVESTLTDDNGNWRGERVEYLRSYRQPMVLGQVMSFNDERWSTFWSKGNSLGELPTPGTLYVGKHVGQDPDSLRMNETIGVMVFEAGGGNLEGVPFEIGITDDSVVGVGNNAHTHTYAQPFNQVPEVVVISQSAMDGGDGGWAVLDAADLEPGSFRVEIQEDQVFDDERGHTTEQVVYAAFETAFSLDQGLFNQAPLISRIIGRTDRMNDAIFFQIDASDPEGETLFFSAEGLPPGVTLHPSLGFISGTLMDEGQYTVTLTVSDGLFSGQITFPWNVVAELQADVLESMVLSDVQNEWISVDFISLFTNPVVVCNALSTADDIPRVVRINRLTSSGFDVRLQNPSGSVGQPANVHCLASEEGTWELPDGSLFEAARVISTKTDVAGQWEGQQQPILQAYTQPVVLGQVLSSLDENWSVFWSSDLNIEDYTRSSPMRIGKHSGEDPDSIRADELLGYMIFEAGSGTINGVTYETGVALQAAVGYEDPVETQPAFSAAFTESPAVMVVTQSGIRELDGSWAVLREDLTTNTSITVQIDEDQLSDAERTHAPETIFYSAFSSEFVWSLEAVDAPSDTTATHISDGNPDIPDQFVIDAPYPNPFMEEVHFRIGLPEAGAVRVNVFDIQGRQVASLVEQTLASGYHQFSWNGSGISGATLPAGVYFLRVTGDTFMETKKVVRVR